MLGGEEVVAPLAVEVRQDAADVIVAEEAVQDGGFVEAGYGEAPDVGDEGDEGTRRLGGGGAGAGVGGGWQVAGRVGGLDGGEGELVGRVGGLVLVGGGAAAVVVGGGGGGWC